MAPEFLTTALYLDEWSVWRTPGEISPGSYFIGVWAGPSKERNVLPIPGIELRTLCRPAKRKESLVLRGIEPHPCLLFSFKSSPCSVPQTASVPCLWTFGNPSPAICRSWAVSVFPWTPLLEYCHGCVRSTCNGTHAMLQDGTYPLIIRWDMPHMVDRGVS
jgi:hypothetical protein